METKTKEFVWAAKLSKDKKTVSWGGRKDGALEQIILKLAVLGPGAKEGRNLVEVTTFDSDQNKIKTVVCSLSLGKEENRSLGDLPLFPPANFTLIEGNGPVDIVGSHLILDEDDLSDEDDEDMSDFEESMEDLRQKLNAKKGGKGDAPTKNSKKRIKQEYDEDEDDEDDEDDEENGFVKTKASVSKKSKMADDDDEDDDDDEYEDLDDDEDMDDDMESDEEDEVEEKAPAKKRKLTNGKAAAAEKKLTSPDRSKKPEQEQKTPVSQKAGAAKTPKSEKKTPSKPKFTSVDELKAAIKKFPGGKPRKQDKFMNWLGNQFKVADDSWKNDLWVWHKKELGL